MPPWRARVKLPSLDAISANSHSHDPTQQDPNLNPLQRLASQTAVYGVSSVLGRFLNYLLVPLYTYSFLPVDYGVVAEFYAYMGFLAVLLAFGLETGYFRFREEAGWTPQLVFATVLRFVVLTNLGFFLLAWGFQQPLAALLRHAAHPEYILWVAAILALDSVGAIAFARLRAEQRALRFAAVKLTEIGLNIALNLFFILVCRRAFAADPTSWLGGLWDPSIGVGYVFLANLVASLFKLALLAPELRGIRAGGDWVLVRRLLAYSLPMVAIGLAGIVNEMLDRAALKFLLPYDTQTNMAQLGLYGAVYKLSILMSLFIQAFRYAGEPFFFAYARQEDARQLYALVLKWFLIFCVFIFLLVSLYLDIFQYFVGAAYREALWVVPILLLANLLLGVYVNLSIWYKLTDRTGLGAWVAITGALVTVVALLLLVPTYGYAGAAWAHLICYSYMVIISWAMGRSFYPVPYDLKRLLGYLLLGLGLYAAGRALALLGLPALVAGTLCLALYLGVVYVADGRALRRGIP